ncbi:MAG: hypothetical protein IJ662_09140 [Clostridia bacterium]|nr:hypothetical protein [Clostridia bacterium]
MKIVLDTDKKTITVPYNYTDKLAEINRMIKECGGENAKEKTFSGYLKECWDYAMAHSDTQLKTGVKPNRNAAKVPPVPPTNNNQPQNNGQNGQPQGK